MARGPGNPPSSVTMEIQQLKDTVRNIITYICYCVVSV